MCRSTAAPLMAMAGMAGTAVGIAFAVLREKADRRSIEREIEEEAETQAPDDSTSDENRPDDKKPGDG